jgi:uncharacterized protein YaaR (DUF327 family)
VKINPGWRPLGKDIKATDNTTNHTIQPKNFQDLMQQQEDRATNEQLKNMVEQINRQGERLARTMTVRELRNYKIRVKQFLEEAVRRGIQLKDTKGWDRRGRGKRYKLLEEIDRFLLDMTDEMLEQEQGRIGILDKVGEIRGMLINLFF